MPPGLGIDPQTGLISGAIRPNASQQGPYAVTVKAGDPGGQIVEQTFVWNVQNIAPHANNNLASLQENQVTEVTGNLIHDNDGFGVDSDPDGDPLRVLTVNGNNLNGPITIDGRWGDLTVDPDGSYSYISDGPQTIPLGEMAQERFTYTISDGNGGTATAELIVRLEGVNDSPQVVAAIPPQQSVDESIVEPLELAPHFNDVDRDSQLTFDDDGSLPPGLSIDPESGQVSGTIEPGASDAGPFVVQITATDQHGESVTLEFLWEVEPLPEFAFDSFNNQAEEQAFDESDQVGERLVYRFSGQRELLISQRIEQLAPEPILAGYAKPGTVLVGRIYAEDGSVLGQTTDTANQAGNWVLNFFGVNANGATRVVIEHVATEAVALGDSQIKLGQDTYRSLQLGASHEKALTSGSILSGSADSTMEDLSKQNINPLNLL